MSFWKEVTLPLTTRDKCNDLLERDPRNLEKEAYLCLGGKGSKGKGGCAGDSGGPLIYGKEKKKYKVHRWVENIYFFLQSSILFDALDQEDVLPRNIH